MHTPKPFTYMSDTVRGGAENGGKFQVISMTVYVCIDDATDGTPATDISAPQLSFFADHTCRGH